MYSMLLHLGRAEAISYILLAGVAMPLKYGADYPQAVSVVGAIHGALWVAYILLIIVAWSKRAISTKFSFALAALSLIPFGPFLVEGSLKTKQRKVGNRTPDDDNLQASGA